MAEVEVKGRLPAVAQQSRLLTSKQVRELLGDISRTTLWRYVIRKRDPLPCVRLTPGAPMRFSLEKVLWWVENQSANPARETQQA